MRSDQVSGVCAQSVEIVREISKILRGAIVEIFFMFNVSFKFLKTKIFFLNEATHHRNPKISDKKSVGI